MGSAGSAWSRSRDLRGEFWMRVQPGADGRAAEGICAEPRQRVLDARDTLAHLCGIAGELLAERDGDGVH